MDNVTINITWEFFLGAMGSLIAIAYYANGRFTGLETNVDWLKEMISELLINAENIRTKLFKNDSPVSLTATGYHVLRRSGLKSYIDTKRRILLSALNSKNSADPYELQRRAFRLLATLSSPYRLPTGLALPSAPPTSAWRLAAQAASRAADRPIRCRRNCRRHG